MVKPFLETETYNRIKFGYSNDHSTKKIMEDLFDKDILESAFGGNGDTGIDINKYAEIMKEDDNKKLSFWTPAKSLSSVSHNAPLDSIRLDADSDASNNEKIAVPNWSIRLGDLKMPHRIGMRNYIRNQCWVSCNAARHYDTMVRSLIQET